VLSFPSRAVTALFIAALRPLLVCASAPHGGGGGADEPTMRPSSLGDVPRRAAPLRLL
jgi:hypothetical protein